jgi:hypothetical protein
VITDSTSFSAPRRHKGSWEKLAVNRDRVERYDNLLIIYGGEPSPAQRNLVESCLETE